MLLEEQGHGHVDITCSDFAPVTSEYVYWIDTELLEGIQRCWVFVRGRQAIGPFRRRVVSLQSRATNSTTSPWLSESPTWHSTRVTRDGSSGHESDERLKMPDPLLDDRLQLHGPFDLLVDDVGEGDLPPRILPRETPR